MVEDNMEEREIEYMEENLSLCLNQDTKKRKKTVIFNCKSKSNTWVNYVDSKVESYLSVSEKTGMVPSTYLNQRTF